MNRPSSPGAASAVGTPRSPPPEAVTNAWWGLVGRVRNSAPTPGGGASNNNVSSSRFANDTNTTNNYNGTFSSSTSLGGAGSILNRLGFGVANSSNSSSSESSASSVPSPAFGTMSARKGYADKNALPPATPVSTGGSYNHGHHRGGPLMTRVAAAQQQQQLQQQRFPRLSALQQHQQQQQQQQHQGGGTLFDTSSSSTFPFAHQQEAILLLSTPSTPATMPHPFSPFADDVAARAAAAAAAAVAATPPGGTLASRLPSPYFAHVMKEQDDLNEKLKEQLRRMEREDLEERILANQRLHRQLERQYDGTDADTFTGGSEGINSTSGTSGGGVVNGESGRRSGGGNGLMNPFSPTNLAAIRQLQQKAPPHARAGAAGAGGSNGSGIGAASAGATGDALLLSAVLAAGSAGDGASNASISRAVPKLRNEKWRQAAASIRQLHAVAASSGTTVSALLSASSSAAAVPSSSSSSTPNNYTNRTTYSEYTSNNNNSSSNNNNTKEDSLDSAHQQREIMHEEEGHHPEDEHTNKADQGAITRAQDGESFAPNGSSSGIHSSSQDTFGSASVIGALTSISASNNNNNNNNNNTNAVAPTLSLPSKWIGALEQSGATRAGYKIDETRHIDQHHMFSKAGGNDNNNTPTGITTPVHGKKMPASAQRGKLPTPVLTNSSIKRFA